MLKDIIQKFTDGIDIDGIEAYARNVIEREYLLGAKERARELFSRIEADLNKIDEI